MAILAALGGALFIGSGDFCGGIAARSTRSVFSTLGVNVFALLLFVLAWVAIRPHLDSGTVALGLGAGVVNAISLNLIYAALAAGAMSLTAPIIASGSALVPTATTAIAGELPTVPQALGIVCVLVGVLTITTVPPGSGDHVPLTGRALALTATASLIGGISFSMILFASRHGDVAQAVGVASLSRLSSVFVCLALAVVLLRGQDLGSPALRPMAAAGVFEFAGTTLFLIASTMGNSAVVAVIVSLYAIVTVLLAQFLLRERIAAHQRLGIGAAAIGIALLSLG